MLSTLAWLSPAVSDFLFDISQILQGKLSCPAAELADALDHASVSGYRGWLGDPQVRSEFSMQLRKSEVAEISNANIPALVDLLVEVVQTHVNAITVKAAAFEKRLPLDGFPDYNGVAALLSEGEVTKKLKLDSVLFMPVAFAQFPACTSVPNHLYRSRLAVVACAGDGLVGDVALALHVLENVDAYAAWYLSQAQAAVVGSVQVKKVFSEPTAQEVALRQALSCILAPGIAATLSQEITHDGGSAGVMKKLAGEVRSKIVIPMYIAPIGERNQENKKNAKGQSSTDGKVERTGKQDGKKNAKGQASADEKPGSTGKPEDELHWQLLTYKMSASKNMRFDIDEASFILATHASPRSMVKANPPPKENTQQIVAAPLKENTHKSVAVDAPAVQSQKFADIWAPSSGEVPPGHTQMSWNCGQTGLDLKKFSSIWAC